jgi:hypothetical protein
MTAPWEIGGGSLSAGSIHWVNVIPTPLQQDGPTLLTLDLVDGRTIRIEGRSIMIEVHGPAHSVEPYPA